MLAVIFDTLRLLKKKQILMNFFQSPAEKYYSAELIIKKVGKHYVCC